MPITGKKFHARALPEFWRSFQEMDDWRASQKGPLYPGAGVLKFVPRKLRPVDTAGKGRLLVSHDFKGGYVEDPFSKGYSFNWWFSTEIFNYFAHHRITIPPPEWITAAHRQGVSILGTIIFEGGSDEDCLRMVIGKLPGKGLADAQTKAEEFSIPVSSYYAELFADLAVERGFDGWLLNVEVSLQGRAEQARGLVAWITLLQQAILRKVGPHGQVIWYDSVTVYGDLGYQNRMNAFNLPFFLNSTGIFTNYWWTIGAPKSQVDYFNKLDPNLTGQTAEPHQFNLKRSLQDIYTGVDVWGRGSHGGGGFGSYKAIEHVDPKGLGLSIALFAQGWTWETEETKPGWNWAQFWDYDAKLWVGPAGIVDVEEHSIKPGELPCIHEAYQPISSFFLTLPPPDPLEMPFYTNFSPGIGDGWFVEGEEVFRSAKGWTDMDKQTTVGDLVWPYPIAYIPGGGSAVPTLTSGFNFVDAWNGGNSLQINLTAPGGSRTYGGYWVPIQSFTFTSRRKYEASIIYKVGLSGKTQFEAKFELGIRSIRGADQGAVITSPGSRTTVVHSQLNAGWQKAHVVFEIVTPIQGGSIIVPSSIGFVIAVTAASTTEPFEFPFLVGQIAVYPHLPAKYREFKPSLLWVLFSADGGPGSKPLDGALTWDVVAALARPPPLVINDPEDPRVAWNLQPTKQDWFPDFLYFNIYTVEILQGGGWGPLQWIGTTGYDGEKKRFWVYDESLPATTTTGPNRRFTFQVEGVLETGEVTHWFSDGNASADTSAIAEVGEQKRSKRTSLRSVLSPLRRKKSKGDIALAKGDGGAK